MKIGIDVDDTITNSWESLIPYYEKTFNVPRSILQKSKPYYESVKDLITIDEYFDAVLPIYDEVIPNVDIRPHVKETIDKLYELGDKVYFITARGKGHTDPYKVTKDFLDKYHIRYEEIIINCGKKAEMCEALGIKLFIDDSYKHCLAARNKGIDVLMTRKYYNQEYDDFPSFDDWDEVYEYVKSRWHDGK